MAGADFFRRFVSVADRGRRLFQITPSGKKLGLLATAVAILLSGESLAQRPSAVSTGRYSVAAFFATTSYGLPPQAGLAFSPDGSRLLVSSDQAGAPGVYLLPVRGGLSVKLLGGSDQAVFPISFFPKDERILFGSDTRGNELRHIFVRSTDGAVRDLTPGARVKAEFIGWKEDGTTFFLQTNERSDAYFDLYAYDAATYERRLVFRNDGYDISAVSGDGRWLALRKRRTNANSDIYAADLSGSAVPVLATQHTGNIAHDVFGFTPDAKALVYSTDEGSEWIQAWRLELSSRRRDPLIRDKWDVSAVVSSPNGRYRAALLNVDAASQLRIWTRSGQPLRVKNLPRGDVGGMRFSRDESKLAVLISSDTSPPDVYLVDLPGGEARRLTRGLNPAIDERQLVEGEVVRFRSYDGLTVPGILYKPKQAGVARPAPVLIWVHGGPGQQSRRGYSPAIQNLVNHGYAVYRINNRGSSGYGKTFFHLDDRRHGDVDLKDVIASKAFLQRYPWVDRRRIGVMGGSYGGYMTTAALAFAPREFCAGIDLYGVTNWVRTLQSIPRYWASYKDALFDEMGDPVTDAERLRRISPLFHANDIIRPMLIVQGRNDPRVLPAESEELAAALRARNIPVEYLLFSDEGHGIIRKKNQIAASEAFLSFLGKHLADCP